jgi:hypothetical protein
MAQCTDAPPPQNDFSCICCTASQPFRARSGMTATFPLDCYEQFPERHRYRKYDTYFKQLLKHLMQMNVNTLRLLKSAIERLTERIQSNGSQQTLEEKRLFHTSIVNSLKEALIVDFSERHRYCKCERYSLFKMMPKIIYFFQTKISNRLELLLWRDNG